MNHWSAEETAFRCQRLSVRLEQLAQTFEDMAVLSQDETQVEAVLARLQISKGYLELTAIDLDVETAYELAQMQRQLSRWHLHWENTWANQDSRVALSDLTQTWAAQIRAMAGVFV
ncbi:hypothetical protein IQ250_14310 [Pseudanabaenaceae cyanobacterium LEGE 13415]|nr:hypothetical protein [Pseudanabaenaceae cyanobacterium LEGE 13415]